MGLENLITSKIVNYCIDKQIIMICGFTKSGKITLAKKLSKDLDRKLIISDNFTELYGNERALDYFEAEFKNCYYNNEKIIIEGILCFRLLRNLSEMGLIIPDIIIKTKCNEQTIRHFYSIEDPNKNINRVMGFNSGLEKIYQESLESYKNNGIFIKVLELETSIY